MGIAASIVELLKRERIPYTWFQHKASYTAQEEAAMSHIHGRSWAKVVICMADEQPIEAVLPAHFLVDLEQLRALAGVVTLRLATEEELARLYPDWEVGAMPPFGAVWGRRVFVERCLVGDPEMVFNAGTHTDAIRMHYWDFAELAKPSVGNFCRCPNGTTTASKVSAPKSRPRKPAKSLD
jgi:Ala-tRNA(Pro) deacylase